MCLYISVWKYTELCYCRSLPLITVFEVTLRNTLLISISFDLYSSNKSEILMKLFISFVYTNLYSRIKLKLLGSVAQSIVNLPGVNLTSRFAKLGVKYLEHPVCTKQVHHWFYKPSSF